MIIKYISFLVGVIWSYSIIKTQSIFSKKTGLLFESGLITIIALPYLIYLSFMDIVYMSLSLNYTSIMLILTGAVTVFPLFFFNLGLKHIPLGLAGVLFYIAPSFHFITSVFILGEYMEVEKIFAFMIIWTGVIIFIYDAIKKNKLS